MDPDETLGELVEAVQLFKGDVATGRKEAALEAAEHIVLAFEALDDWLCKGGFIPRRWANGARGS